MSLRRITDRQLTTLDLRASPPGSRFLIRDCDALTRLMLPDVGPGLDVEVRFSSSSQEILISGKCSRLRGGISGRPGSQLVRIPSPKGDGLLVSGAAIWPIQFSQRRLLRDFRVQTFGGLVLLSVALLLALTFVGVAVPRRLAGLCLLIVAIVSPGPHGFTALDDAWELLTSDE